MSKIGDRLKELETKMELLSKQLGATQETILQLHQSSINISGVIAQTMEEKRREDEKTQKKFEISVYYQSLVLGLLLGVIGNLFVSYLMKVLEILNISPLSWVSSAFIALLCILVLIWLFYTKIKKLGWTELG